MRRERFSLSHRWEGHHYGDVPVKVASESYREFTRWLDRELEGLVARWAHAATPRRSRHPRFNLRVAKPK